MPRMRAGRSALAVVLAVVLARSTAALADPPDPKPEAITPAEPGAAITIDGQSRGEFPALAPLRVATGSHAVRVTKEGFESFATRVEVAGGQSVRVVARLHALTRSGRLRVAEQRGRVLL